MSSLDLPSTLSSARRAALCGEYLPAVAAYKSALRVMKQRWSATTGDAAVKWLSLMEEVKREARLTLALSTELGAFAAPPGAALLRAAPERGSKLGSQSDAPPPVARAAPPPRAATSARAWVSPLGEDRESPAAARGGAIAAWGVPVELEDGGWTAALRRGGAEGGMAGAAGRRGVLGDGTAGGVVSGAGRARGGEGASVGGAVSSAGRARGGARVSHGGAPLAAGSGAELFGAVLGEQRSAQGSGAIVGGSASGERAPPAHAPAMLGAAWDAPPPLPSPALPPHPAHAPARVGARCLGGGGASPPLGALRIPAAFSAGASPHLGAPAPKPGVPRQAPGAAAARRGAAGASQPAAGAGAGGGRARFSDVHPIAADRELIAMVRAAQAPAGRSVCATRGVCVRALPAGVRRLSQR